MSLEDGPIEVISVTSLNLNPISGDTFEIIVTVDDIPSSYQKAWRGDLVVEGQVGTFTFGQGEDLLNKEIVVGDEESSFRIAVQAPVVDDYKTFKICAGVINQEETGYPLNPTL